MNELEHIELLINTKFEITNVKLDGINGRLDKINGSVGRHDKIINEAITERGVNRQLQSTHFDTLKDLKDKVDNMILDEAVHMGECPQKEKIRAIEDTLLTQSSMKKYQAKLFFASTTILGIIIAAIGVWIKLNI